MRQIIVMISLTLVQSLHSEPQFGSLKILRERTKHLKDSIKIVNEGKGGSSIKFAAKTDFLYPGLDKRKSEKVKKLWQDYYNCQQALYDATQRLIGPEALAFLEGSNAVLECEVCESPRDLFTPTQWFYSAEYDMNKLTVIFETSTIFMKDSSLYIYNVVDARGGLYMCKKGPHSARPYVVNIFGKENTKRVVPEHNKEGLHPAPDAALPELNATITTAWAEWTQCSRCDYVGKKYRTGICTVVANKHFQGFRTKRKTYLPPAIVTLSLQFNNETTLQATYTNPKERLKDQKGKIGGLENQITSSANISQSTITTYTTLHDSNQRTTSAVTSEPRYDRLPTPIMTINLTIKSDLEILDMFEDGIPCRSQMLSEHTRSIGTVVNRSSEVMVAYCKLPCPKNVLFVVVNDKAEILETANNSEGIYSIKQGLPQDFPAISRTVLFATYGKFFKIQCPGSNFDSSTQR